jgi:putative transposase
MVNNWWNKLPQKYTNINLNDYIVMPNHVHGIIIINVGADPGVCPKDQNIINYSKTNMSEGQKDSIDGQMDSVDEQMGEHVGSPLRKSIPLSHIIQWFKTMTTNEYIRNVKQNNLLPFKKHLWQRNYYEHIVRDENELDRIRKYIVNNPLNWDSDEENPHNKRTN